VDELDTPGGPPELADDEKLWAMLAHLSPFACLAFIGPIVALVLKQDSPFVKYHATQALVFQAACLVGISVISSVTCGFGAPLGLVPFLGSIYLGVQAYNGSWDGYPLLDSIGRPAKALDQA